MTNHLILIFLVQVILIASCNKGTNKILPDEITDSSQVQFYFPYDQLKEANSNGLTTAIVSLTDIEGNEVKSMLEVDIYSMSDFYICKPITLPPGKYKLTQFLVQNSTDKIVFATPAIGSKNELFIETPLPVSFTTLKNEVLNKKVELYSCSQSQLAEFGYQLPEFENAKVFNFQLNVFVYNSTIDNFKQSAVTVKAYNQNTLVYSGSLKENEQKGTKYYDQRTIDNTITLPEKYNSFTLEIKRLGYKTFRKQYTKEELRKHYRAADDGPLVINLEEIDFPNLIAYYPFNGSFIDTSGNNYHAINSGCTFSNDKYGIPNSSIKFDGIDDYVLLPSHFDYANRTISFWFKAEDLPRYDYDFNPTGSFNNLITSFDVNLQFGFFNVAISNIYDKDQVFLFHSVMGSADPHLTLTEIKRSEWSNIIITSAAEQKVCFYVNGEKTGDLPWVNYTAGEYHDYMVLGASRHIDGRFFNGTMDELRIYNRVLSDKEITILSE